MQIPYDVKDKALYTVFPIANARKVFDEYKSVTENPVKTIERTTKTKYAEWRGWNCSDVVQLESVPKAGSETILLKNECIH